MKFVYESVRVWPPTGNKIKSPAIVDKTAYFVESAVSFFSSKKFRNDQYPYMNMELRVADPNVWAVLEKTMLTEKPNHLFFKDECRMDWVDHTAKPSSSDIQTCIIVSESVNNDDTANGLLVNVVTFSG